jgi:hypothetical protein
MCEEIPRIIDVIAGKLCKRHAGDLYSGDSVNVVGSAYDIYERGISDFENGPPRAGAHAPGPAGGFARRL